MTNPSNTPDRMTLPIACDLTTLDAAQRSRRAELADQLKASTTHVVETPNGYELHLGNGDDIGRQAAELVALESRCCAFLALALRRDAVDGGWILAVGGRDGAKAFIAADMGLMETNQ